MIIDGHAHMGGEYQDLQAILDCLDNARADMVILCPSDRTRSGTLRLPHFPGKICGENLNYVVNWSLRLVSARQIVQQFIDTANEEIYRLASFSGGRVIQFFWADPLKEGIIGELEEKLGLWGFRGIKLHQSVHRFHVKSRQFQELITFAQSKNLPVFIHFHSRKEIRDFIDVAGDYTTRFIVGHIIGLKTFIKKKQAVSDNLFFDISCPPLVSLKRTKRAIREFGPRRIVMGSDTPYGKGNLMENISRIRSLDLSKGNRDRILGQNMKEILMI